MKCIDCGYFITCSDAQEGKIHCERYTKAVKFITNDEEKFLREVEKEKRNERIKFNIHKQK